MSSTPSAAPIYRFLTDRIAAGDDPSEIDLPDEPIDNGGLRYAPGARDGIATHHVAGGGAEKLVGELFDGVRAMSGRFGSRRRFAALATLADDRNLVTALDPLLTRVRERDLDGRRLHAVALGLATTTPNRGAVKLGITLLGLFPAEHHREVLLTLGRHDEFALFAAVALNTGEPDAADDLWTLAREVTGWGRIHAIERLADTDRPEILDWILRAGFRNSVMNSYLAYTAATKGDLLGRLTADDVDDELLLAAGDLLSALFVGGPAQDIHDYADGAAATQAYLRHVTARSAADLRHLLTVADVRNFATCGHDRGHGGAPWPDGWTDDMRAALAEDCTALIDRPEWAPIARLGVASADSAEFWRAEGACELLGVPTLTHLIELLRRDPLDTGAWHRSFGQADEATVDEVVALAIELLPLGAVATGAADELGLGREFAAHTTVAIVVQELRHWPGRGWPLLQAALASPVTGTRNSALAALGDWPRDTWPAEAEPALRAALEVEPNDRARGRITAVLDGKPLDD